MPLLVRGVAESQETGMTLIRALEKVVDNKMVSGPLSKEVKQLVIEMSWGTSFEDALTHFKNRINSPIVNRFCVLVLEASRSGGTIKKVFTATSGFMEEMKEIDRDTSAQMKPYIIVIYAAFAVFIVTAILLVRSFFAPMEGSQQIMSNVAVGGTSGFKDFFYQDMLVSGLTGGLMAGKIGERRVASGMKHSILLLLIGYLIFLMTIPPNWV
jgi:flagellar protein FlaJ